jgi:competence protein ComEC
MTPSKIFLYFCFSFVGGIFISSMLGPEPIINYGLGRAQIFVLWFLILGLILISVFWRYKKLVVIGFCILFLILGIWRHNSTELRIINSELRKFNDSGQNITLIGMVSDEPDIREKSIKLTIKPSQILAEDRPLPIFGKILVTANRYPEYQYGDKLRITGKLETPPIFKGGEENKPSSSPFAPARDFNYKEYLKKEGIFSLMSWPEIEVVGQGFGNPVMKFLFSFKNKFKETARAFISPPEVGILEALIFGDEGNISQEWKAKLNFTGTRHITAVSGMNITIIASLLLAFALGLGFWRQQAFYFSIFLLSLYILMIGAPASAVRAGIMGGLLLTAQHLGRLSAASRAAIFAATAMLALNPLLLRLDVGFQLSFLAILGIIYLQPFINNWFKKIPSPKIFPLRITLSTTIAAQIFTLPILVYNFGYIPLISPLTNILIVPFLAPITISIFIFGLVGMIFEGLGLILSWPIWLILTYITKIIDWFSQVSWASQRVENVHWGFLIIFYLILGFLTWRLQEREKLKFLNY